jgi:hypothetical protein
VVVGAAVVVVVGAAVVVVVVVVVGAAVVVVVAAGQRESPALAQLTGPKPLPSSQGLDSYISSGGQAQPPQDSQP